MIRLFSVIYSMKMDSKARKIFNQLPKDVQNYFREVDKNCKEYGITFRLGGGQTINFGGGRCGGYFCDHTKQLALAMGRQLKWILGTLVHEESHFEQWIDLDSVWHKPQMDASATRFFNWLKGHPSSRSPETDAKRIIELEADCERRTIKKIKKHWSKYISIDEYARSANAYMFAYLWMAKSRKWIGDFTSKKRYIKHFPAKIHSKYETLPNKFWQLFEEAAK